MINYFKYMKALSDEMKVFGGPEAQSSWVTMVKFRRRNGFARGTCLMTWASQLVIS